MSDPATNSLESMMRHIAAKAPEPWYPSAHARATGVPRDSLDPPLDRLRLAHLIRLTDWIKDLGQGYVLTPEGEQVLSNKRYLAQLEKGQVPAVQPIHDTPLPERPGTPFDRAEEMREALLTPKTPVVSMGLIAINVIVYVAGQVLASQLGVEQRRVPQMTGGVNAINILEGQWWRLITACFVHGGLLHLAMNMYALYSLGPWAERLWGSTRFLILYLLAGFAGSCGAVVANVAGGVGASGAICGILGAEAIWVYLHRTFLPQEYLSRWGRNLLVNTLLITFISMMPGISAAGHFGGAAAGMVAAYLLNAQRYGAAARRRLAIIGLLVLPVACVGLVVRTMHQNPEWLDLRRRLEANDIVTHYRDPVNDALNGTLETYESQVAPLLKMNVQRRNPEQVQKAVESLTERQGEMTALLQRLDRRGAYATAIVEEARQASREFLEAGIELCRRSETALKTAEDPGQAEAAVQEQLKQVKGLQKSWNILWTR